MVSVIIDHVFHASDRPAIPDAEVVPKVLSVARLITTNNEGLFNILDGLRELAEPVSSEGDPPLVPLAPADLLQSLALRLSASHPKLVVKQTLRIGGKPRIEAWKAILATFLSSENAPVSAANLLAVIGISPADVNEAPKSEDYARLFTVFKLAFYVLAVIHVFPEESEFTLFGISFDRYVVTPGAPLPVGPIPDDNAVSPVELASLAVSGPPELLNPSVAPASLEIPPFVSAPAAESSSVVLQPPAAPPAALTSVDPSFLAAMFKQNETIIQLLQSFSALAAQQAASSVPGPVVAPDPRSRPSANFVLAPHAFDPSPQTPMSAQSGTFTSYFSSALGSEGDDTSSPVPVPPLILTAEVVPNYHRIPSRAPSALILKVSNAR